MLTDWQWRVKWALGERDLPGSYIEYLLRSLWPEDIDAGEARQDLERAQSDSDDEDAARQVRWAEARIEATEKAG